MAKKIPPALMEPAIRLEVAGTPDAHQGLAEETKNFLATQNVDSFVISDSDTTRALIIKPEPLNADQPVNVLTSLSRGLLEKGCVVHFSTGHYLSDIGAFNAFGKHLGGQSSLSLPWVELQDDGPLETLTMHEVRHFHQSQAREASRNGNGSGFRPEVRVKLAEENRPDNWLGRTEHYNGVAGHSIDEVDAYLYQSKLHLSRAERKAKVDVASARTDARKAVTNACKAYLFAEADSKALRMKDPIATPIEGEVREVLGDFGLSESGNALFIDSRDFPQGNVVESLNQLADDLVKDGAEARTVAGKALQILSKDPGAVEAIKESIEQIKAVGWIKS